jgi:hypothetical protein
VFAADRQWSNTNAVFFKDDNRARVERGFDGGKVGERERGLQFWFALRRPAKKHDGRTSRTASSKERSEVSVG